MIAAWFGFLPQRLVRPVLVLAFVLLWGWTTLALHYSNLPQPWLRTAAALLFMAGSAALFWKLRWAAAPWFLVVWAGVATWWTLIPARLDRDWQPEVAVLPTAEIRGDKVTVRNVRKEEVYFLLDGNCTTSMVNEINEIWPGRVPISRRILMNGYLPEQVFENGAIRTDLPFEEMLKSNHIDAVARRHDRDPEFSRAIREHPR